jgi:predicted nucleic acid-binding protein
VTDYLEWDVIENDRPLFLESLRLIEKWKVAYWDVLVLAAARKARTAQLWSEDLNSSQDCDGLIGVNPFVEK